MNNGKVLETNKKAWEKYYSGYGQTREFPDDYIIRFYNHYLKQKINPKGRMLDFGFGLGNNSVYFMERGLDVHGVDVADSSIRLTKKTLKDKGFDASLIDKFKIVSPHWKSLPFENDFFDFILANNVLYYYSSEKHIQKACRELSRCLRPGGVVFFAMCGPKNSIMSHTKQVHGTNLYKVSTKGKKFSVDDQIVYLVKDKNQLKRIFSEFKPVSIGHHDELLFDRRDFSWIFVGQKSV